MKLHYVKTNPQEYEDKYEGTCTYQLVEKGEYKVGDIVVFLICDYRTETLPYRYGKEVLNAIDRYKGTGFKDVKFKEAGTTTQITAYKETSTNDIYQITNVQEIPDSKYVIIGFVRLERKK